MSARSIRVRGVVQGVGFRPFVYRLARTNALAGWVLNESQGVDIHLEGAEAALDAFVRGLSAEAPPAAFITTIEVTVCAPSGCVGFTIRETGSLGSPTTRISPDLPVCEDCLLEMRDPANSRYRYPYINCTNCGPRYTVIERLPYDRPNTTMKAWPMDAKCSAEYHDPANRRFHAEPIACPDCGPAFHPDVDVAAALLREGKIVAIKGIGGYHLACDARNEVAVRALRERKFRKEKPFAVMARSLPVARTVAILTNESEALLSSTARPIVLAPMRVELSLVAPDNDELGLMLPYAPLHHLLFDAGAPELLVLTSANRSSEPIAYQDDAARESLAGIADALLVGERPIARRVDDSVARVGAFGPMILRRSRGYAPGAAAVLPVGHPILAVGADLKNTITLVADGQAFVSQHIGDLDHYESRRAFLETIEDLISMYEISRDDLLVVHDKHPQYASTLHAAEFGARTVAVQHHIAHIASVLAEKQAWDKRVIGVSFDGAGFGDDGTIWGGEFFAGSMEEGFHRIAHLRPADLVGGDAAARCPVQCAAGFCDEDLTAPPFNFPERFRLARQLLHKRIRTMPTTSVGRLFDTVAALLGFTREISFEGQAAMWVEHRAVRAPYCAGYPFPFANGELDFRPLVDAVVNDRRKSRPVDEIARAFQLGVAQGTCQAIRELCAAERVGTVALSGGVFQNDLLLRDVRDLLQGEIEVWVNSAVPPNDGGISLGQAALAAFPHA